MIARQPGPGHQLFMEQARGLCARFEANGIPPIEQIALLGQLIGGLISDLDPKFYTTLPVLEALMQNVVVGNEEAGRMRPLIMGVGNG